VLPTLAVILWAYGMYALFCAWSRRKNGQYLGRNRRPRYALLALAGSTGAGLALVFWLTLADNQAQHHLKLAGFLTTVWAEGWPEKSGRRLEYPQLKGQAVEGQPAYALLHPETPPAQLQTGKLTPAPRRLQKLRVRKGVSPSQVKTGKAALASSKKEKLAAKSRAKKKKPAAPAEASRPTGG
jgi:hypothetical protein